MNKNIGKTVPAAMIKPKPTRYKDTLFRSRLEARWAVFYDLLGIRWEYEKEQAFVTGARTWGPEYGYKPDFFLPQWGYWIEIKPYKPDQKAMDKAAGWARNFGDTFIFFGDHTVPKSESESAYLFYLNTRDDLVHKDTGYYWCECQVCGKIDIRGGGGWPMSCDESCITHEKHELLEKTNPDLLSGEASPRLVRAYHIARHWQFNDS